MLRQAVKVLFRLEKNVGVTTSSFFQGFLNVRRRSGAAEEPFSREISTKSF
jgi:hypothetical protein